MQIENSFESWWSDINKLDERKIFLHIMSKALSDANHRASDIERYIKESLDFYLNFSKSRQFSLSQRISFFIFHKFPKKTQVFLKKLLLYSGIGNPIKEVLDKMEESGTKVDKKEFQEIEKLICDLHNLNK